MPLLGDLRLILRDLLWSPGYASAAILTLALAVGANSAIFSAVYAVLLKPSAIADPERLVVSWDSDPKRSPVVEVSYRNFQEWTAASRSFTQAAAIGSSTWPAVLDRPGDSVRLSSAGVSSSFFETLGVRPQLGRLFRAADDLPNAPGVAVLSHAVWAARFGADPGVTGTIIQLDRPHTVVGIAPEGFDFPRGTDIWVPVAPVLANAGGGKLKDPLDRIGVLFIVGRLRDGTTPGLAAEELDRIADGLQQKGGARFGTDVVVTSFLDYSIGPVRQALWALGAAVGLLLLIGCANVSGLMLTRVSFRSRDQAIRMALGATRTDVARRWALEALLLSFAGGALGLLMSRWIAGGVIALAPVEVPRLSEAAMNLPVALFTLAAVIVTALVSGAQPIWQAGRSNLVEAFAGHARATEGKRALRARSLLLGFQIALTVVMLVAAVLVVRSFINLRHIDPGFKPSNVLSMTVDARTPPPSANEWMRELLARVERLPGVESAGAVSLRPLALGPIGAETWVVLEGQAETPAVIRQNPQLNYLSATPGYFTAMGIELRAGRLFDDRDTRRSPRVAVVSESTAQRLWPGGDPLGRRLLMPGHSADGGPNVWRTVVGVVSDVRYRGLDDLRLDVYDAAWQADSTAGDLVVRASGDPIALSAAVHAEARALNPRVVIDRVTTMDAIVSRAIAPWRFSGWMFTLFALLAFVLSAVGLFSLVSLDVAERRHEFAVRLALGARRVDVRRSVLRRALLRVTGALTVGLLGASVAARAIRHLLFGVAPIDVATYAGVAGLVVAIVTIAAWLPARRAAAVDPLAMLRRH